MMQDSTATRPRAIVAPLIRLVINAAIPVLVYLLVRPSRSAPARPRSWPCPGR